MLFLGAEAFFFFFSAAACIFLLADFLSRLPPHGRFLGIFLVRFVAELFLRRGDFVTDFAAADFPGGALDMGDVFGDEGIDGGFDGFVDVAAVDGALD